MTDNFDADALRMKESRFNEFVEMACETYGVKYKPQVIFIDGLLPENPSWLACIEIFSRTIKVSRTQLLKMSIEQIKETAFHEVTHIFDASHDTSFHNILDDVMTTTWEPPSGVIVIDGNIRIDELEVAKKKTESKPDKVHCNHCGTKTELEKCPHCSRYFCEGHFKPILPSMPNFNNPNRFNEWKNRGENHHPCPNYYDYLRNEEKEKLRKYEESLDKMSGRRRSEYRYRKEVRIIQTKEPKPEFEEETKFCPECGTKLQDDFKFCTECGNKLE